MKPVAVVFDLYGTLLDYSALARSFDGGSVSSEIFVSSWRTKQIAYAMASTLMGTYADFDDLSGRAYAYAAALHGAPNAPADRERATAAWSSLPAFADVVLALDDLREHGIATAVLSNGTPRALTDSIAHARLAGRFAHVLSIDAVRKYKPHPDVYALVTAAFACTPSEILFVSSNGWDATGAAAFGFRVAWCNRGNLPNETIGHSPTHTMTSLADLTHFLE